MFRREGEFWLLVHLKDSGGKKEFMGDGMGFDHPGGEMRNELFGLLVGREKFHRMNMMVWIEYYFSNSFKFIIYFWPYLPILMLNTIFYIFITWQKWINNQSKASLTMTLTNPSIVPTKKILLMPAPIVESRIKILLSNVHLSPVPSGSATTKGKMEWLPILSIILLNPNTTKSWHILMVNSEILQLSASFAETPTSLYWGSSKWAMETRKAFFSCAGCLA